MSNVIKYDASAFPAISTFNFGGEECQSVNLRDLWRNLAIAKDFSSWAKDQLSDFEHRIDFEVFTNSGGNPSGGRPSKEYAVTLDTAKHIALSSRTARGREIRDYFIAAEKQLRSQMPVQEPTMTELQMIARIALAQDEANNRIKVLEHSDAQKDERIAALEARTGAVNAPLAALPGGMEIKSRAIRRLASKHGLSKAVCDEIFDYYWNQLRSGITVVNPNEQARAVTPYCDAFYTKTINDVFNRVMKEIQPNASGKMFTHKSVAGAFHVNLH